MPDQAERNRRLEQHRRPAGGDLARPEARGGAQAGVPAELARVGQRADFVHWQADHPAELCYWLGGRLARAVYAGGHVVARA